MVVGCRWRKENPHCALCSLRGLRIVGGRRRLVEKCGGDFVHLDVMDGCFVPQITFGQKAVTDLRPVSRLPFDTHLMICQPEQRH